VTSVETETIKVLGLSPFPHQNHYYDYLKPYDHIDLTVSKTIDPAIIVAQQPDIVLTLTCHLWGLVACIAQARDLKIPTLLLQDGVVEWRHTWENPTFGAGGKIPFNQPIANDKIAVFGWRTARTFDMWGNQGKCEPIGAPRFDHYLTDPVPRPQQARTPKRLLVMTANTLGFDDDQRELATRAIADVKQAIAADDRWQPIWRVTKHLDEQLALTDDFPHLRGQPLREAFAEADAVITTPSTVALEAMLVGLPTAVIDYTNSPMYAQTGWFVSAQAHLARTLEELAHPPATRLLFQDEILHNNLLHTSPATPRLLTLIEAMVVIGREARANDTPLVYPPRIMPYEYDAQTPQSDHMNLQRLYPAHEAFQTDDVAELQYKLSVANQRIAMLLRQVENVSISKYIGSAVRRVWLAYDRWRKRRTRSDLTDQS
jgi:hypothetical protein